MRAISILIAAYVLALGLPAAGTTDGNCLALESAFAKFIREPTSENAQSFTTLLPAGAVQNRCWGDDGGGAAQGFYNDTGKIENLVRGGSQPAYEVATALVELSDGEWSTWLSAIIGEGVARFPKAYLTYVQTRQLAQERPNPCLDAVMQRHDFSGDHVAVLRKRLAAVEAVQAPNLAAARKCAIDVLNDYMSREPLL